MGLFKKNTETYTDDKDFGYGEPDVGYGEADNGFGEEVQPTPVEDGVFTPAVPALKIVTPKGYKDGVEIADLLMNGNTILLNVEGLAKDQGGMRLLDYLSGAVHVSGGIMKKVSAGTIVIAPANVDVSSIEDMVSPE